MATVQYMAEELHTMRKSGASQTDGACAGDMSQEALEASIAADADEAGMEVDWAHAQISLPEPKAVLNMRVDQDVLAFFKQTGRGYQTRINAVLRAYVEAQR